MIQINTENILFICGGAFEGIQRIIEARLDTSPLGFTRNEESKNRSDIDKNNMLQYVNARDLRQFGLIPELVGRLPVITYLDPLDKAALRKILVEPKNALVKQYKKLFAMEGVAIDFDDKALNYIVDKAMEFKLGARGLRSICEAIVNDAMFEMPSAKNAKDLKVTLDYAMRKFEKSRMNKLKAA